MHELLLHALMLLTSALPDVAAAAATAAAATAAIRQPTCHMLTLPTACHLPSANIKEDEDEPVFNIDMGKGLASVKDLFGKVFGKKS
jgi:hypothetical protein